MARGGRTTTTKRVEPYKHPEADSPMRPEVGTQARFKKKKPPQIYRYDSSLSPALDWDGQNSAREQGEQHLAVASERLSEVRRKLSEIDEWQLVAGGVAEAEEALRKLQAMSGPFLSWAGKAERLSFDVPTLPLFVHERLSTMAIIETLKGHKSDRQMDMNQLFLSRATSTIDEQYNMIQLEDGSSRRLTQAEIRGEASIPPGKRFMPSSLYSDSGGQTTRFEYEFEGKLYPPLAGYYWRSNKAGFDKLSSQGRLIAVGNYLRFKMFADDFPLVRVTNCWDDVRAGGFGDAKIYVVQTNRDVVERCVLLTTGPGDLVIDPTCGSGTTAYVAEQWGRRWITIDTSRVPLALSRQRLLTATFPYYELNDESRGPAGGFVYKRKQTVFVPPMTGLSTDEPVYQRPKVDQLLGQAKPGEIIRNLLVEAHQSEEAWAALRESMQRLFGCEILPPDATGADIIAEYQQGDPGPRLDVASAGSGFQQVLMLLTFLHTRPASVLLLEEPDAHLHVILQDAIYGELRSVAARQGSQRIMATHSEVIINSVDPRELCVLFERPRIVSDEAERAKLAKSMGILTDTDIMLALVAPGVLYLEGRTDLDILREWAKILGHPAQETLSTRMFWKPTVWESRLGGAGVAARDHHAALELYVRTCQA